MRGIAHIGIAVGLVATHCAFASVWYVNKASTSTTENGRTWGTAFKTIQPAIDAASNAGGGEVWVARGVYDEARISPDSLVGVNTGTLLILTATSIYGGFAGNELAIAKRDWSANLTVIDGSTSRDGAKAYHVTEMFSDTLLDGLTIRGGAANGPRADFTYGGGTILSGSAPIVRNCTYTNNSAGYGGAVAFGSNARFDNCRFSSNIAGTGGAVYGTGGRFIQCVFTGNRINVVSRGSSMFFSCCLFQNNDSAILFTSGYVTAHNCVFVDNTSEYFGGAIYAGGSRICDEGCSYDTGLNVYGCTFYNNSSKQGRAIWTESTPMVVRNSVFWGSTPEFIYFGPNHYAATPTDISSCIIQGGFAAGSNILDQDPLFVDAAQGDFRLLPNSPAIDSGENLGPLVAQFPELASDFEGAPRPQLAGYDIGAYEYPPRPTPDVDGNGQTDAVDIQVAINSALGLATDYLGDINHDGASDAVDIQLVINAALNL